MKTKFNILAAAIVLAAVTAGFGQPTITTQPQHQTILVGTTASFWVVATGTPTLAHQWQKLSGTWSDLTGCTATNLCLTNVQSSHAGDYRVVITNADGAIISDVARLTVLVPPKITPTTSFQHQAVHIGSSASFRVTASGTVPLAYQWRLDGADLSGQTNWMINLSPAQPADEGDYTAVITNVAGAVTSAPARLYVVPPATNMVKGNYTNAASVRLPYFYHRPAPYDPERRHPLVILMHGTPIDENVLPGLFVSYPGDMVFASYNQQATDPVILVWPSRRAGDNSWTPSYLQLVSELIDKLIADFSIDTNRVCIAGISEGLHAAWDLVGMRPSFFAAAGFAAGWSGTTQARIIREVPAWAWCAANDDAGQLGNTQGLVQALRNVGGKPIYTEYASGGHLEGILMALRTPVVIDWFLAQRRGSPYTNQPLVSITSPTSEPTFSTGASVLSLAGEAEALGKPVTRVTWKNNLTGQAGIAQGTNAWSISAIPLRANGTNTIVVAAITSTSWSAGYGGSTTFNDTLTVIQSPIKATFALLGTEAILNWTGGGPPYRVQRATDLAAGDWTDYLTDATPPVTLPLNGPTGFYRITGQ